MPGWICNEGVETDRKGERGGEREGERERERARESEGIGRRGSVVEGHRSRHGF